MRKLNARRGIAALAVASTAVALMTVSTAAHATSSVGGAITAAEMMSRAQYWVDNGVPYTESGATAPDPEGTQYREDCSGFVSMAWHLNTSLIVTDPAPYDFTNVDGTPNAAYDHGIGSFGNLQQGDAMAYPHQHIFLFDQWTDSSGDFTYYAESNPSDPTHGPTSANINSSSLEGWPTSGYVGLRYNNLAAPASTPTGADTDSSFAVYNPDTKSQILLGLGSGGHLGFSKSTNGGASWSNWAEANAYWTLQGKPAAVYDAAAKTTLVFARGSSDGAMGVTRSGNDGASWTNWTAANLWWSNFKGDASAVYNPDTGKATVFARGGDGRIGYSQSSDGGASFTNWSEVNAYWNNFSGDPHAVYDSATKTMTVFAKGSDGRIGYTQSTNDGASWSNWSEVNAYWAGFAGDPHVLLNPATGKLTVFARGGDGRIGYTQSSNNGAGWSNWSEVNAYWAGFAGDPTPVYNNATKTISLLARGGDGRIGVTQSSNDGAGWSNWIEANMYWNGFTADPAAVYDAATAQDTVFALGGGGHMGYSQGVGAGWTNWSEVNAYWTLIGS